MMFWLEIVLAFIAISIITISWIMNRYSYWKQKGIPYVKPKFPFGVLADAGNTITFGEHLGNIYNKYKKETDMVGIYIFWRPNVLITDLDLVKKILIKDFNCFHDRSFYYNEKDDPLSAHLFSLDGQKWKILRSKMTPTFTTGKMKFMFPTIVKVAEQFSITLQQMILDNDVIEMKELFARYTTDVIGTCAFGIECNSLKDPNAEFRQYGQKIFGEPRHGQLIRFFLSFFPEIGRMFHVKINRDDIIKFFMGVVQETIEFREKNNIRRNDFMDLLIQMKNTGQVDENEKSNENFDKLTFEEVAAQAYLFFAAGFETSSTTLSFCLYELAINQDIQTKAREEIKKILENHNGQLTYEAMMEMTYIHKIIDETLRKYPPGTLTVRESSRNYDIPDKSLTIEKGVSAFIPIYGIHHDPELYPNPERFDPERFSPEMIKNRHICAYLPFGEGPRNCIGLRFGKMEAYVGLITLLKNFKFNVSSKLEVPLTFVPDAFVLTSKGGLWLEIKYVT